MQQAMITSVIHPAISQQLILGSSIHVSYSDPEGTATSFAAACLTSVIAARAREADEMYSVSIELNSVGHQYAYDQQLAQHHQTFPVQVFRHQVSGVACVTDLFDPQLLVLLYLPQQEVLGLHVFDGAAPAAET